MSIKSRFILLFVILLLAGLGVSSTISFKVTEQAMIESALTTMDHANLEVVQKVDLFHKKAQSDLLMAMGHPAFMEYFSLPETQVGNSFDTEGHILFTPAQQRLKKELDNWSLALQKRMPIAESCLLDQSGQEHSRVTFGKVAANEDFSSDESKAPFFASSMALQAGEVHIQYPYLSADAKQWVFSYSAPVILPDGSKPALFHYEIPLSLLQSLIRPEGARTDQDGTSHFVILEPTGLIVADSERAIPLAQKNLPGDKEGEEQVEERLGEYLPPANSLNGSDRFVAILERMQRGERGSGWYESVGERFYVAYRPLSTFGWSVAHIRPHHALLQGQTSVTGIRLAFLLIALVTLLLSAVAVWLLVERITRPLQLLTQSAQRIAGGNLDFALRVAEGGTDELGVLARTFNHMLETLGRTTDSKAFTDNIFRAMVDGLLVLDQENRLQRLNAAMQEMLGRAEPELLGSSLDEHFPDRTFTALMFRDLLSKRMFRSQETTLQSLDKGAIPVSISGSLIWSGEGMDETVSGTVLLVQDLRQRKQSEEQLHFLANFDPLTKLPNRVLLHERLQHALTRAPWHTRQIGVLHCALDRFKEINDTLGHASGDEMLRETANRLRAALRDGDTVARSGGDEFIILFDDIAKAGDLPKLVEKIAQAIAQPLVLQNGQEVFVTASMGISLFPDNGSSADELLRNADIATHFAKAQGKNQYYFFSADMNKKGELRLAMESDLRRAIERGELEAFYQPRWDLREDRIVGAEALVRWRRGGEKLVSPAEFLPLAEELGLLEAIDLWMLRQVCRQSRQWRDAGYPPIRISANISPGLFRRKDLVESISRILDEEKLEATALELELTEAIIMDDVDHAMGSLQALRGMWIHLAVDDFGTGYSSFSQLRRLPVHVLKIDRSFVQEITTNREDLAIARAIITMAQTLNLRTTAEGVEEQAQRDTLTELGCDEMQGYLISRPLPAAEMAAKFLHPSHRS
ncbi:MAG: EAL domain-containing protein [Magnetococcus sp. YQC-3]